MSKIHLNHTTEGNSHYAHVYYSIEGKEGVFFAEVSYADFEYWYGTYAKEAQLFIINEFGANYIQDTIDNHEPCDHLAELFRDYPELQIKINQIKQEA